MNSFTKSLKLTRLTSSKFLNLNDKNNVLVHNTFTQNCSRCYSCNVWSPVVGKIKPVGSQPSRLDGWLSPTHHRTFWGVSVAFNQVDPERVRLAGPDRAAAEWVLRNAGSIKWAGSPKHLQDYNMLPSTNFDKYKVEEIDLTAADVIGMGFQHLENLEHVKSVKLHGCRMIQDDALSHLSCVKDTLEWLEISRCPMITDKGLLSTLPQMKKLKSLIIYDLIEIKDFESCVERLRNAMPLCQIQSDDPLLVDDSGQEQDGK